jgi:hypothetical protein
MDRVISKRSFFNFYGGLCVFAFLSILGILAIIYDDTTNKGKGTFGGLILLTVSIYAIITLIKICPKITIDQNFIQFNTKSFKTEDVKKITFTGQNKFSMFGSMDSAKIVFKDRSEKYIFDSMYSNTSQIKLILDLLINNNEYKPVEKIEEDLSSEHFYDYKGFFLLSFNGIIYLAMSFFFIFLMLFKNKIGANGIYGGILFIIIFNFLFKRLFNYFQLNRKYFRIKNHMIFWKKETFKVEDIKAMTFQSQGRAPHCLKIVFKDYSSKKYAAATLSDSKWKELQKHLRELDIKVHNLLPI